MQALDGNYDRMSWQDLMSKKGIVQNCLKIWTCTGKELWRMELFRYSFEHLQFQSLYNRHCFIIEEELA